MSSQEQEFEFEQIISKLRAWRDEVIVQLRSSETREEALKLKLQLDAAIGALEFCQRFDVRTNSRVTVLPDTKTQTPSSVYRVLEDHETEERAYWVELEINGEPFHLYPGDMIIR